MSRGSRSFTSTARAEGNGPPCSPSRTPRSRPAAQVSFPFHSIPLHIAPHYSTSDCNAYYGTLHCVTLHYIILHGVTLHYLHAPFHSHVLASGRAGMQRCVVSARRIGRGVDPASSHHSQLCIITATRRRPRQPPRAPRPRRSERPRASSR
jgi:hypothetical protein